MAHIMTTVSSTLGELKSKVATIVERDIAPLAEQVDRECLWPVHSMKALAGAGILGLQVPEHLGGHGHGLLGLTMLTEMIGKACPSSALCFGMHCVGSAVISAKATAYQQEHYLRAIAAGNHITSLALSETGSGAHFYLPATQLEADGDNFLVTGTKQFITNGGHADSYVVSAIASTNQQELGDMSCLVVDAKTPGLEWQESWHGMGMRGNSSRGLRLNRVPISKANLLGEPGDQVWYVFEVIAPYFLMAMAGTYLGIAEGALEAVRNHLKTRRYGHSGDVLGNAELMQARVAELWIKVEKTRALIYEAAHRGDMAHPEALPYILACKADAGDTAVAVTNEAMTIFGGTAYRDNSRIAQMLRDARASHVMAPTTDLLKLWTGRALLDMPLL
jgi:isovaleryl-CoA dehydrogenase